MKYTQAKKAIPPSSEFPAAVIKHLTYVAHELATPNSPYASDEDDLFQELAKKVLDAHPQYNPKKGSYITFVQSVVRHAKFNILRRRSRDHHAFMVSLDVSPTEDGVPLVEQIADENNTIEKAFEEIDVQETLSQLSVLERQACELIMKGMNVSEVTRSLRISRTDFDRHLWPTIQKNFSDFAKSLRKRSRRG